ncbi:MAG: GntR family transcriptional regulator [Pirellulales bacterium]
MQSIFPSTIPVVRQSLGEVVYERLLSAILSGQLVGGDELSEVNLAEQFGVSRTPVREALNRLANDGLVENGRNRRATVRTMTRQMVVEVYQVRQCLESGAARLAADGIAAVEIARLDDIAAAVRPSTTSIDQHQALVFDTELHTSIARHCGNRKLADEVRRYSNFVPIFQRLAGRRDDRLLLAYEQHLRIIDTLRVHDGPRAAEAMSDHIQSALDILLADVFPVETAGD